MKKGLLMKLGLILILIQSVSCIWIQVMDDVDYPAKDFANAYETIQELTESNPDRDGFSEFIHIMVYDGHSRDYVNLIIPIWMIETGQAFIPVDKIETHGPAGDINIVDLMNNVWDMGPGLIVQVDDIQSETTVLIWLE